MSKFFNETQRVSQWAQKRQANQGLDIKQMLEVLKQGSASGAEVAEVRLDHCHKVHVANGKSTHFVLDEEGSAPAALEAYRGLRTKLMRVQVEVGLRSIVITSSLPGEGKTLTVMNLGLCYSQLPDQRVLIVDADLRTRGLTNLIGHPNTAGLAQVLTGQAASEQAILATDHKNLFILPAGSVSTSPPELFTGARWRELLGWCSETFKVVLVDTPPILPLADFELISAGCDGVVVVVRANHSQREVLQKAVSVLNPKKLLGIVYNASDPAGKDYYAYGSS